MKTLLTGNEAIARGAYEAGVQVCSAYPGTPSTEIMENMVQYKDELYCEWATNEKVAAEVAYGASMSGVRALCAMKHVGLNVAADPVFTAVYNGVGGGYVIVSADDPDMHSSQNEQDNRYYAKFAKMPLIEPSDSQECIDFIKEAFRISEEFDTPVLFRVTTRVCHSKSLTSASARTQPAPAEYQKNARKFVCTPGNAKLHHPQLEEKLLRLAQYAETSPLNQLEMNGRKIGVISSSIAYQYAKEAFPKDASFLKLGFSYPLPMQAIRHFAAQVETLYVVEELEPFMEEQIKAAGIPCIGKEKIPRIFELNPEILACSVFGTQAPTTALPVTAADRPPVLCPGCPHRGFFYTLSKGSNFVVAGDIGCYTLGSAPPLNCMDSALCMGGGFTVAMGLAKGFAQSGQTKKVFGVLGDSTYFHSGLTGAVEVIYNKGDVILCVLDNSITSMTGQQDNPSTGYTLTGQPAQAISIEATLASFGFEKILVVDPQDLKAMQAAVDEAVKSTVPTAIISRRPCLLIKGIQHQIGKCQVNQQKCRSCKICLKVGCPAVLMGQKASIDQTLCVGCTVCAQACPFGAIERLGDTK